ncbi:CHAT domain-containing protein [Pseudomonas sp. XS1P51]
MSIDSSGLSRAFRRLSWQHSTASFLAALSALNGDYIIIAKRYYPHGNADLLVRSELIKQFLEQVTDSVAKRRKLERVLRADPGQLAGLLVSEWGEGFVRPRSFRAFLLGLGFSFESVPVIDIDRMPAHFLPDRCVIVRGTRTLGVFDEQTLLEDDVWRSGVDRYDPPGPMLHYRHSNPRSSDYSEDMPRKTPPPRKIAPPFIAHPRITPDTVACAEQLLHFTVGFSASPDADADELRRIKIVDASPGEKLLIVVSAEGAAIKGKAMAELELDMTAECRFMVLPGTGLKEITLRAHYMFRDKLVGAIVKTLDVESATSRAPSKHATSSASSCTFPLADAGAIEPVDIVLWVQKETEDRVAWMALKRGTKLRLGPFSVSLKNPQALGKRLANLCSQTDDHDESTARAELRAMGKKITRLIPKKILNEVLLPALSDGKVPSILLLTDEPYVPWELASFAPDEIGQENPAYLGEVAQIGRWWTAENSPGPVSQVSIKLISALAGDYQGGAMPKLKHALQERELLHQKYKAKIIVARESEVKAWLDLEPRPSGHLAHVALHGYSDIEPDMQGLRLEDGFNISPYRFAGDWYKNQTPRFTAVFLNACQVGTAGEQLGCLGGFPGAVIAGGASAFIAPLWEVKDDVALQVAKSFYKSTLSGRNTVGETFRRIREGARDKGSITSLAYLFYGHPLLRMSRPKSAG